MANNNNAVKITFKAFNQEFNKSMTEMNKETMAKFISSEDFERIVNDGLFWATFRCSPDMVAV